LAVAGADLRQLDSFAGKELCDPQQVVGDADQAGGETDPLNAWLEPMIERMVGDNSENA
jgi:hypothetical protein